MGLNKCREEINVMEVREGDGKRKGDVMGMKKIKKGKKCNGNTGEKGKK